MQVFRFVAAFVMAFSAMSAQAVSTGIPITPDNVVFISGDSRIDTYLNSIANQQITVSSYVHDSTKNYQAWYGQVKANAIIGVAAGTNLLIIKRSAGGSAMGIYPLIRSTRIEVPNWSDALATADATLGEYTVGVTTAAAGLIPDIGASELEPRIFSGLNLEAGYTMLTGIEISTITASSWTLLAEGIVATNAVPANAKLSTTYLREALDGHVQDWSKIDGSADPIVVCRQIEGSGSQASYNAYFMGTPCTASYNGYGLVNPAITTDSLGYTGIGTGTVADPILIDPSGYAVFEGNSANEVRMCLQAAQLGVDTPPLKGRNGLQYKLQFSLVGVPSKAIGVLSLDSYTKHRASGAARAVDGTGYSSSTNDPNGEWSFRTLHGSGTFDVTTQTSFDSATGIVPSRDNILNGDYDFVYEPSLQYRTADFSGTLNATQTLKKGFFKSLLSLLGNPASLVVGSTNNPAPLAYGALSSLYTKGVTSPSNLVADYIRQGNTCSPPHVFQ